LILKLMGPAFILLWLPASSVLAADAAERKFRNGKVIQVDRKVTY